MRAYGSGARGNGKGHLFAIDEEPAISECFVPHHGCLLAYSSELQTNQKVHDEELPGDNPFMAPESHAESHGNSQFYKQAPDQLPQAGSTTV